MANLDHWHPVLLSRDLNKQPVGIRLHGQEIVLFRTRNAGVGALEDVCPHRRMRLSAGTVRDGKLRCAYHGWTYDCAGQGESPGSPKLHACVTSYDCCEAHGAVWIKARGVDRPVPELHFDGHVPVGVIVQQVRAPLELVMDNYGEVEHTVAMHDFGIHPNRAHEAVVSIEPTETAVVVRNTGPAKPPPFFGRRLLMFRRRFLFHSDFTFTFQPPLSVVEHRWTDPRSGREAMIKYRLYHFFVPVDGQTTKLVTFAAVHSRWRVGFGGGVRLFGWYMRRLIKATVAEDIWLLENLADQRPDIDGLKLSRFDRILGLTRERLQSLYYGESASAPPAENACTPQCASPTPVEADSMAGKPSPA